MASPWKSSRFSPWAAFCGADHRKTWTRRRSSRFSSRTRWGSTALRRAELRSAPRLSWGQSDVGLMALFSDVTKLVQFSLGNLDIVSTSSIVSRSYSPSCSCVSQRRFFGRISWCSGLAIRTRKSGLLLRAPRIRQSSPRIHQSTEAVANSGS